MSGVPLDEELVPLERARERVLAAITPLPPTTVPIADALGCVLAREVVAREAVPPFTNSAVDGYALRAQDTSNAPVDLAVVGTLLAGAAPGKGPGPGEAIRIMTGAPLPPGADAACMLERTEVGAAGATVRIARAVAAGENVRYAGEDVVAGEVILPAGTLLGPGHLGVLASQGMLEIEVHPRPRVGVLSTGSELVANGGPLAPGQIRDSNRVGLLALVARAGFAPVDLGLVSDDEAGVAGVLASASARCDAVLTSGGVSVGDRDVVRAVLEELAGDAMTWMQVAIRPAKPFAFATLGPHRLPVFGLPGNPVSALVSFELFARPALRKMAGASVLDRPVLTATATAPLRRRPDGKLHLVRVIAAVEHGALVVTPAGGQGSHQLLAMARANALALVEDGTGVAAGGAVSVMLLEDDELGGGRR